MNSSLNEPDYPVRNSIFSEGKTVTIEVSANMYFGNHDSSESGERIIDVVDFNGMSLLNSTEQVLLTSSSTYLGSSRNTRQRLIIKPDICPVKVLVNKFSSYSTSDYPHFDRDKSDYYFVLVEK